MAVKILMFTSRGLCEFFLLHLGCQTSVVKVVDLTLAIGLSIIKLFSFENVLVLQTLLSRLSTDYRSLS